jgi:hypothetical protein
VIADVFQVPYLAHAVAPPVTLIQPLQPIAGELGAGVAELSPSLAAKPQPAMGAGLGFVFRSVMAPMAGVLFPQVGHANAAIDPTGGDQIRVEME